MELTRTRLDFEKELRQVESEVSEQVKGQFAQELHDNIGQLLTAMHIQVENQKISYPSLSDGLKPIEIYLAEISQQLRLLSRTLNNDYLGHVGLFAALQTESERINSLKRLKIHWPLVKGSSNLDKNQELMVFRIFQEVVQNALRHSSADNLFVTVNNESGRFEFTLKDDGKGFLTDKAINSPNGSGLRNIMKRANLAGMECLIESAPGTGCLITLKKVSNLDRR